MRVGIQRLQALLDADGYFGPSRLEVSPRGDLALVSAPLLGDPNSKATVDAIGRIRDDYVPRAFPDERRARVLVGGDTAFNKDFFEMAERYMPIVFSSCSGSPSCCSRWRSAPSWSL